MVAFHAGGNPDIPVHLSGGFAGYRKENILHAGYIP